MHTCYSPHCNNQIEVGIWCNKCIDEFIELTKCMNQPPSFFWKLFDFISTKIENLAFKIEYILAKRKVRKKK